MSLCECGCGADAGVSKSSYGKYRLGQPLRFLRGHSRRVSPEMELVNFIARIDLTTTDMCWNWTGTKHSSGYGKFSQSYAHRWSWEWFNGEKIPPGMFIDHICKNKLCVRPDHIRTVTPWQNTIENSLSPSAMQTKRDFCIHGHPLSGDNLYLRKDRYGRVCKMCCRLRGLRYHRRRDK